MQYNLVEIGKRIKRLRNEKKMTQEQLAEELFIGQEFLSKIDRGKRRCSIELLISIADYFEVTLDYLIRGYVFGNMPNRS